MEDSKKLHEAEINRQSVISSIKRYAEEDVPEEAAIKQIRMLADETGYDEEKMIRLYYKCKGISYAPDSGREMPQVNEGNVGYEETRAGERYQMAVLDALQGEGIPFMEADNMIDIEYELIGDCLSSGISAEECAFKMINKVGIDESKKPTTKAGKDKKIGKVMGEFKDKKLKTSAGKKVTDKKQAFAIAASEAGISKNESFRAKIVNESLFDTKLSRVKKFLSDKAEECEEILEDYEGGRFITESAYKKAEFQLEIISQIMDMLDMD